MSVCGRLYISSSHKPVSKRKELLAASLVVGTVRRLSAPQLTLPWPKRHAADLTHRVRSLSTRAATMTSIMSTSSLALRSCFHCCSSTARTGHGHSLPLAGGTPDLPGSAASEFGDAAMARSSCGRATRSCVVHAVGTRNVTEPLCDCTVC